MQTQTATTYNIHAYPTHLIHSLPLTRGRQATLRPVLPQDAPLERAFVAGLSQTSRRNRFHGNLNGLSDHFAEQITCIDYVHQMGFVVTMLDDDGEVVIADACYVLDEDGDTAEFAPVSAEARSFAETLAHPYCGPGAGPDVMAWFGERGAHVRSLALLGLREGTETFGLMVMGSEEPQRFYPGMGTLYLEQIGDLAAAALVRVRH